MTPTDAQIDAHVEAEELWETLVRNDDEAEDFHEPEDDELLAD